MSQHLVDGEIARVGPCHRSNSGREGIDDRTTFVVRGEGGQLRAIAVTEINGLTRLSQASVVIDRAGTVDELWLHPEYQQRFDFQALQGSRVGRLCRVRAGNLIKGR